MAVQASGRTIYGSEIVSERLDITRSERDPSVTMRLFGARGNIRVGGSGTDGDRLLFHEAADLDEDHHAARKRPRQLCARRGYNSRRLQGRKTSSREVAFWASTSPRPAPHDWPNPPFMPARSGSPSAAARGDAGCILVVATRT